VPDLNFVWIALALAVFVVAGAIIFFRRKPKAPNFAALWPYAGKQIMTEPGQVLFKRLVEALPECVVFAQVPLSRFLQVEPDFPQREWRDRIGQMSVDFAVCLPDSTVVAVIDLNAGTYDHESPQSADRIKEKALESAGITLVRYKAQDLPGIVEIRNVFTR